MEISEEYTGCLFDEAVARGMMLSATTDLHLNPSSPDVMDQLEFTVGVYLRRARQLHEASRERQEAIVRQLLAPV